MNAYLLGSRICQRLQNILRMYRLPHLPALSVQEILIVLTLGELQGSYPGHTGSHRPASPLRYSGASTWYEVNFVSSEVRSGRSVPCGLLLLVLCDNAKQAFATVCGRRMLLHAPRVRRQVTLKAAQLCATLSALGKVRYGSCHLGFRQKLQG